MSCFLSSRGSIQTVSIILLSCLLIAGSGYIGYHYFLPSNSDNEIITNTPFSIPDSKKIPKIVTVSGLVGSGFLIGDSGDTPLKNNSTISFDHTVFYTDSESRVALIFADRSIIRLDASTRISLQTSNEWNITISLEKGRLWARIIGNGWGQWKMVISLGNSKAIVQWTSLEAIKLPLLSKYTVFDSSAMSGSSNSGIDIIDASGTVTHVQPENKWVWTELWDGIVNPINIEDAYKNDAFALMNTQEDIVHLQDAITRFSDTIDVSKAEREILASIPTIWSNESTEFFSGTTITSDDLSGNISSSDWSDISQKVLIERMTKYSEMMKQNDIYMNQVFIDQKKLRTSIINSDSGTIDHTNEIVKNILKEQEMMLSSSMMQTQEFLWKIDQDINELMVKQWQMVQWILDNTMNDVQKTINNSLRNSSTQSGEWNDDTGEIDEDTGEIDDDKFFTKENNNEETSDENKKNNQMNMGDWGMSNGWNSMNNGNASGMVNGNSEDTSNAGTMNNWTSQDSENDTGSNSMNMDGNSMSNGSDGGMSMGN